ncbi:hypothetical protein ACRAWD_14845 [Caulobacter segnis]
MSGSRRLSLTIVFVVFHLVVDLLVGDSPGRALPLHRGRHRRGPGHRGLCQRFRRGAPRIRSMRCARLAARRHHAASRRSPPCWSPRSCIWSTASPSYVA